MHGPIIILFFLSGFTGLVYQIAWMRCLNNVFGASASADAAVVTSFMAGLALGSYVLGRFADRTRRPLRFYAYLELLLALYALASPLLFDAVNGIHAHVYQNFHGTFCVFSTIRFLLCLLVLLPPAFMMGGTLPAISRTLIRSVGRAGPETGLLYGIGALGAAAGCFATGFLLIRTVGVRESIFTAVAINVFIALAAIVLSRMLQRRSGDIPGAHTAGAGEPTPGEPQDVRADATPAAYIIRLEEASLRFVLIGCGIAGFTSLAYVVLWARILSINTENSTYSASLIVTIFLLGIALGSCIYSRSLKNATHLGLFGRIEVVLGSASVGLIFFFRYLPLVSHRISSSLTSSGLFAQHPWSGTITVDLTLCIIVILFPAILAGITFPLVVQLCTRSLKGLGYGIGRTYAVNTTGSLLGSLSTVFLLLPSIGIHRSLTFLAILNILLGIAILARVRRQASKPFFYAAGGLFAATALAYSIFFPQKYISGDYHRPYNMQREKVLFYDEGKRATVTVSLATGSGSQVKILEVDGAGVAGTAFVADGTQVMQGHLPLLLHPDPEDVCTVGIGTGETGYAIGLYDLERITVVELLENLPEALSCIEEVNHGIFGDRRVDVVIDDARAYLAGTGRKFDVIINDSVHPALRGNAALYTRDYFMKCRNRLKPGGIVSTWLPNTGLSERDFKMVLKTFRSVFPRTTLWMVPNCINRYPILIGTPERFSIKFEVLEKKFDNEAVRKELSLVGLDSGAELLNCMLMDEDAVREYSRDVPVNTDNDPLLEFSTPFVMFENIWRPDDTEEMMGFLASINSIRSSPSALIDPGDLSPSRHADIVRLLDGYFESTTHLIEGHVSRLAGRFDEARSNYLSAVERFPGWEDARRHLHVAYVKLGRLSFNEGKLDEAIPHYTAATKLGIDDTYPHYQIGLIHLIRRRYDQAISHFDRALAIDPGLTRAYYQKAQAFLAIGEKEEACANLEKVLEHEPDLVQVKDMLGAIRSGLEKPDS